MFVCGRDETEKKAIGPCKLVPIRREDLARGWSHVDEEVKLVKNWPTELRGQSRTHRSRQWGRELFDHTALVVLDFRCRFYSLFNHGRHTGEFVTKNTLPEHTPQSPKHTQAINDANQLCADLTQTKLLPRQLDG